MRCNKIDPIKVSIPFVPENSGVVATWSFVKGKPSVNELFQSCFHGDFRGVYGGHQGGSPVRLGGWGQLNPVCGWTSLFSDFRAHNESLFDQTPESSVGA
jgi:hypothetical protein